MIRQAKYKKGTGMIGLPIYDENRKEKELKGERAGLPLDHWSVWKVEINPKTLDDDGNEIDSNKTFICVTFHSEKKFAEMPVEECVKRFRTAHCRVFEYDRTDWTEEEAIEFLFSDKGKKPNNGQDVVLV